MGRTRRPSLRRAKHAGEHGRPWKLIVTTDPQHELGQGRMRHYRSLLSACNAFVKAPEPFKTVIYDDGHEVRELDDREQALLERVCLMLGYEIEEVDD